MAMRGEPVEAVAQLQPVKDSLTVTPEGERIAPMSARRHSLRRAGTIASMLKPAHLRRRGPRVRSGPLVSVVIATYNWSSVLRHAIESVCRQSYPNWELIVAGDACTDDSEQVVSQLGDARIRWLNLEANSGSQSAPNNAGLALARGELVAYLGHDDVWYPSHLALLVRAFERHDAELAFTITELIGPEGTGIRFLAGLVPRRDYTAGVHIPPSSLMHRTQVARDIGGWRDYREIMDPPDVDFTARAAQRGLRFVRVPALTVFKFPSGIRPYSYVLQHSHEQAAYAHRMSSERMFLPREILTTSWSQLRGSGRRLSALGLVPPADPGPGWQVREARRIRGLD